jgi:hypothetical protein
MPRGIDGCLSRGMLTFRRAVNHGLCWMCKVGCIMQLESLQEAGSARQAVNSELEPALEKKIRDCTCFVFVTVPFTCSATFCWLFSSSNFSPTPLDDTRKHLHCLNAAKTTTATSASASQLPSFAPPLPTAYSALPSSSSFHHDNLNKTSNCRNTVHKNNAASKHSASPLITPAH